MRMRKHEKLNMWKENSGEFEEIQKNFSLKTLIYLFNDDKVEISPWFS